MTTEDKLKNFKEGLGFQLSKMNSKISYLREHKFDKEADYHDTKRKVLREIADEFDAVFFGTHRHDGHPNFEL